MKADERFVHVDDLDVEFSEGDEDYVETG
jgi:hypothetical protein